MRCVVNERHRERFRGGGELDRRRVDGTERHAALTTAETLGLRLPARDSLELRYRNMGAREYHCALR
jgi:hypothetical protein